MNAKKRTDSALIDDASPLAVFLVKSGSNGDRLLFRYPYQGEDRRSNSFSERHKRKQRKTPYVLCLPDDCQSTNTSLKQHCASLLTELFPLWTAVGSDSSSPSIDPYLKTVMNISDNVLSNLFAVKSELYDQKFELKINAVRFVGHPVLVSPKSVFESDGCERSGNDKTCNRDKDAVLFSFNIVFALKASASHDIVNSYHECSQRVAIALRFEEKRVGYLSEQTSLMLSLHDEVASMPEEDSEESPYRLILEKSSLAADLKKMYDSLRNNGLVHLRINRWIEVSFCVPQKVHRLTLNFSEFVPEIGPQQIKRCLESLRPYHAILLLVDAKELLMSLPPDASPAFSKIIRWSSPFKNLLELSADSAVALPHVFHVVAQLITWAKVTVIYPLCESNMYIISPLAPTAIDSPLVKEFKREFNGADLFELMSKFSFGVTLCQLRDRMKTEEEQKILVRQVIWMLKSRLLLQIHTYINLVPLDDVSTYLTRNMYQTHCDRSMNSLNMTDSDQLDFNSEPRNSFPSEGDSLAESPVSAAHGFGAQTSSKSDSEDDLSSPKCNISFIEETATAMLTDAGFNPAERASILRIPASQNLEDLRLFIRLCPYFNGKHHLEDIMYYENVRRQNLLTLIEKFKNVLLTCSYEDTAVAQLCPSNLK
ncbi:hypothetical protein B4U79_05397 [Dinothrombium tinctorium]|uniref:GATOR complex protein NPRL3 n=1 Tax=Dinothrombium tinctorium TaxID=1965070 RepID=A0A443QL90_9ACAR|nr:hypothetical protein B4U79_05397 [Dinothrombium tinctorium]